MRTGYSPRTIVEVGAADRGEGDANHRIANAGAGVRDFLDPEIANAAKHGGAHRVASGAGGAAAKGRRRYRRGRAGQCAQGLLRGWRRVGRPAPKLIGHRVLHVKRTMRRGRRGASAADDS